MKYSEVESLSWLEMTDNNSLFNFGGALPPMSVHYPVNPPGSRDFIHVEPSFTVCRKRVYPNLVAGGEGTREFVGKIETLAMQFAFGESPFVPDPRRTVVKSAVRGYPLPHLEYRAGNLKYSFKYACAAIDKLQSIAAVECEICNECDEERRAFVTVKFNVCPEKELFEYHYVHYYWNAQKWLPQNNLSYEDQTAFIDGVPFAKALPGNFRDQFEQIIASDKNSFNREFSCSDPYWAEPQMRILEADNVLRFSAKIPAGVTNKFTLFMLADEKNADPLYAEALKNASFAEIAGKSLLAFKGKMSCAPTFKCAYGNFDEILLAQQVQILQLLVDLNGEEPGLKPTQGGSSERFYVWIWEAMHMLKPMLRMGFFDVVRKALDNIFSLQDAGCPPEGEFQTVAGSIGTTGPKWANSTGSALDLAASYYLYSKDYDFTVKFLPRLLKAADWIIREIRVTRRNGADGKKILNWGLMPFARATDGDSGYVVAQTDVNTLTGLEKFVNMLDSLKHPLADEYRKEAVLYRSAIKSVLPLMILENGFIERQLPIPGQDIRRKFKGVGGGLNMACAELLSEDQLKKYLDCIENNFADGLALFPMDREIVYTTFNEHSAHSVYLRLGKWKKAFAALRTSLCCAVAKDTWLVSERFSKVERAYTPWQPNGSGSGRIMDMILNSVCFELTPDSLLLLGGMPFDILKRNGMTELKELHTQKGRLSLRAEVADNQVLLNLVFSSEDSVPGKIVFPDFFTAMTDDAGKTEYSNVFTSRKGKTGYMFTLKPTE